MLAADRAAAAHPRVEHRARKSQPDERPARPTCWPSSPSRSSAVPIRASPRRSSPASLLNYYFTPPIHRFTIADARQRHRAGGVRRRGRCGQQHRRPRRPPDHASRPRAGRVAGPRHRGRQRAARRERHAGVARTPPGGAVADVGDAARARSRRRRPLARDRRRRPAAEPEPDRRRRADDRLATATPWSSAGTRSRRSDQRLLAVFGVQAGIVLAQRELAEAAAAAKPLAEADRLRTALLAAVSHDLRSPLASATAAVDSLSTTDISWAADGARGAARHCARVAGAAHQAGREPARHEPAAGRRAQRAQRADPPRRGRTAGPRRAWRRRASGSSSTSPSRCPRSSPTRRCSSG